VVPAQTRELPVAEVEEDLDLGVALAVEVRTRENLQCAELTKYRTRRFWTERLWTSRYCSGDGNIHARLRRRDCL